VADFLLFLPILLFSVVAHEFAHAWVAYRQGDDTALLLGRLTLNPRPHLDPVMSVIVPVALWILSSGKFTFGAARPVPIDPRKFRHPRKSDLLVSSAGIAANLLLALACAALFVLGGLAAGALPAMSPVLGVLQRILQFGFTFNVFLAFFNLLPVPPLDGSHLFYHLLPARVGGWYRRLAPVGFLLIMGTLMVPGLWDRLMWPIGVVNDAARTALGGFEIK
jgi:Zn-dependent protease